MMLFHAKMSEIGMLTEEEEDVGEIVFFCNTTYVIVMVYFTAFESVLLRLETLVRRVKGATFESSEPLHLLRLNGCVDAIST